MTDEEFKRSMTPVELHVRTTAGCRDQIEAYAGREGLAFNEALLWLITKGLLACDADSTSRRVSAMISVER